jgi:DNA-binding PadR family transcriptional regulator
VRGGAAERRWMKGSPLKGALLALLSELGEPAHPYLLATLLRRRLGPASRVEAEAVYKMLEALERAGLIVGELRDNERGSWRRQRLYSVTDVTARALDAWMAAPVSYRVARAELQVKIAFSRPSDIVVLLAALDVFERQCMEQLEACEAADDVPVATWTGVALNVACDWVQEHVKADLAWIMSARERMRDFAARHGVAG